MSDLNELTKEQLLEIARERDLKRRSVMDKDELVRALERQDESEGDGSVSEGGNEVRDAQDLLTPTGDDRTERPTGDMSVSEEQLEERQDGESEGAQERYDEVEEASPEAAEQAQEELDFRGPLHLQAPEERIMTGAVNEKHADEQRRLLEDRPDDHVGDVTEAGFDSEGNVKGAGRGLGNLWGDEAREDYARGRSVVSGGEGLPEFELWNDRHNEVLAGDEVEDETALNREDEDSSEESDE